MNHTSWETFFCECESPEHQVLIATDEDTLYVCTHLAYPCGFWGRLRLGLSYIFGRTARYGHYQESIFYKTKAKALAQTIMERADGLEPPKYEGNTF